MINPILEREMKTRMRSWKAPFSILAFLLVIAFFSYMGLGSVGMGTGINPEAAINFFDFIAVFQMILIMFVVPLLTATAISSEREKQTLDMMLCADISAWQIVIGKMLAALSFVLLLVVLAMPFFGFVFMIGGISIFRILMLELYYLAASFSLASVGLYCSAKFKKSLTSIIATYLILGVINVFPFFMMIFGTLSLLFDSGSFAAFAENNSYIIVSLIFGPNPGFGLLSLLANYRFFIDSLESQAIPWLVNVPTWAISCMFFALISSLALRGAKKELLKRKN